MKKTNKPLNFIVKILLGGVAVLIAEFLLPGIHIDTVITGFILAAVIILINITLKPILVILTLPITVVTLGLFLLVINALMIMLADRIIPGFQVDGFWWAILFAIVLSVINSLFGNNLNQAD
ncbi:phage holin family protein [Algoriphagus antarcticus]|uniref:Putative membrane protein n=1 Tax=Algoriphagus antarcticus TaxID=238540 RepID=A0A3E0E7K5_9BACT|nr:phage holin family protein [Algoriphagus antarcticus]REG94254.1 putative membrane protein [Algoriphagus antarcticus]